MNDIITNGLDKHANRIRQAIHDADEYMQDAITCYAVAGQELCQARDKIASDKEFGKWRAKEFPDVSNNKITGIMNLYRRWGNILLHVEHEVESNLKMLPETILFELAAPSTSDSVINQVEEKLGNGEKVTKKVIRNMKKEDNEILLHAGREVESNEDNEILLHAGREVESKGVLDHIKARKQQKEAALRKDLSKELLPVFKDMLERMLSMSKEKRERTMQDFINSVAKL